MRRWLLAVFATATLAACKVRDPPPVTGRWADHFARESIGLDYLSTGKGYAIEHGALSAHGAHRHPLWLRKRLPHDVRIDLDCWSNDPAGDIEVELFGDGKSHDPDVDRVTATGYVLIFGGWNNTKSMIARLSDRGTTAQVSRTGPAVVPKRHYHWRIEREGATVRWFVDAATKPFLVYNDLHPLTGPAHDYFGFTNRSTDTWFDNLVIAPL